MEELLKFFKNNGVAIQITIDLNCNPTVHAIPSTGFRGLQKTEGKTVVEALEKMKANLFGSKAELKVGDRVTTLDKDKDGFNIEGMIVSVSDYREPSMKYAVDIDKYGLMFFGEGELE